MAKPRKKLSKVVAANAPTNDMNLSVRKISNGWVISKSWMDGRGRFKTEEVFSESEPTIGIDEKEA